MAINLDDRYPGRANPKTLDYPQGSFKNRTSPTSKDGTYLEQDWANDMLGFFQAMMNRAGLSANGNVDTAQASQYLDALIQTMRSTRATETEFGSGKLANTTQAQALVADDVVITPKKLGDVTATETRRGIIEIATAAEAQALTDDQRALTPKKLADAFGGANQGLTVNGYQKLPGGLIIQWGLYNQNDAYFAEGQKTVNLPITFPNAILVANATGRNSQSYVTADTHVDIVSISTTKIVFYAQQSESSYPRGINGIYWLAIGY